MGTRSLCRPTAARSEPELEVTLRRLRRTVGRLSAVLRKEINDVVVKYLEHKLQTDNPVNVVVMANEMVQSLVDVIIELDETQQAPLLASLIATLGDEYLGRRGLITTGRRDN
jgi:hypothetical protein